MADYNYIIENHQELTGVGRRTHDQIDAILDYVLAGANNGVWKSFYHVFTEADLVNEISPAVVRIDLPTGMSLTNASVIIMSIDGRIAEIGEGWRPTSDGKGFELYIPTNSSARDLYVNAEPVYLIKWISYSDSGTWNNFSHELSVSDLVNEIAPSVIRVDLPAGLSLTNSPIIMVSIDGRTTSMGQGWRPSLDGNAIEIYLPEDPQLRALYFESQPLYLVTWLTL